ncbi:MAG: hypothetical protein M1830_007230 [Pleopsidium flavum]|nr:MAG: hypothetical protein M1830_007230 [Pleopsidium flavum]
MTVTGLYFLPSTADRSTFRSVTDRLTSRYELTPLPRWTLEHRLMRETPRVATSAGDDKGSTLRYLQFLNLSHHPSQSYVAIAAPQAQTRAGTPASSVGDGASGEGAATIVAIPSGVQSEEMVQLVVGKLGPLWSHRQTLHVSNGTAYEMEDFHVRLGELRQGQSAQIKGVVAEVEWLGGGDSGSEEEADWDTTELVIRAFWDALGLEGAREFIRVPELGKGRFDLVSQYCQLLRVRV